MYQYKTELKKTLKTVKATAYRDIDKNSMK